MATIKKAQSGAKTTKKPESTVMKPLAKKDRYSSLGGEIGQPPFGGKKPKPGTKVFNGVTGKYDVTKKNGGAVKKAKSGGSFPDLNKDGKVTKADILKGRGVIAKRGMSVKKAQNGAKTADSTSYFRGRAKDMARKSLYAEGKGDKKLSDVYMDVASKSSSDASRQANKGKKGYDANGYPKKKAKSGTSMKKCMQGCK